MEITRHGFLLKDGLLPLLRTIHVYHLDRHSSTLMCGIIQDQERVIMVVMHPHAITEPGVSPSPDNRFACQIRQLSSDRQTPPYDLNIGGVELTDKVFKIAVSKKFYFDFFKYYRLS